MLPSSRLIAALLPPLVLSAGCWPPPLAYERICTAPPERPLDLIHVEDRSGPLRLFVFARSELIAQWPSIPQPVPPPGLPLGRDERLFLSADSRVLGSRRFTQGPGGSGDRRTNLRFLGRTSDLPTPPADVLGGRHVHVSGDGSTLLLASSSGEGNQPTDVLVFRRPGPGPGAFPGPTSYQTTRPGAVQLSRTGNVIAQEDGDRVRILRSSGGPERRIPAGVGFQLAPSGEVLAVHEPTGVVFHRLTPGPGVPQRVPLADTPLQTRFAPGRALTRTAKQLAFIEPGTGQVLWTWAPPQGKLVSASLVRTAAGRFVIGVGRLEVSRPSARSGGTIEWGSARAFVDVLDEQGRERVETFQFDTSRWNDGAPSVRLVEAGRRVLVRAGDSAWISEPLP